MSMMGELVYQILEDLEAGYSISEVVLRNDVPESWVIEASEMATED